MDGSNRSLSLSARRRSMQSQRAWKYIRDNNTIVSRDLGRIAIDDGVYKYTYGMMFREWERYASVFSALCMTGENKARVGLLSSMAAGTIFSLYALNMIGAEVSLIPPMSALKPFKVMESIRDEKLTDFIITDDFAGPNLINDLLSHKNELGLRNVILLHVSVAPAAVGHVMSAGQETKYRWLRAFYKPICMDTLLNTYGNHPISYVSDESSDTSFIIHTSGTTGGTGKPIVHSDRSFNMMTANLMQLKGYEGLMDSPVCGLTIDLSNAYGVIDQVHFPLALGGTVAIIPGGALNPSYYKSVPELGITVMFAISAMFEHWMKLPEAEKFDFSSIRCVVLGGAAVSASDKRRYYDFLREHGATEPSIINGYGISELGGACCLSTGDLDDEAIGFPIPGVDVRLFDEDKDRYLSTQEAPCEGVLYLHSDSMAAPGLDGSKTLNIEEINGKTFICTNDLARIEADGRITYLGRANRYFINDEGMKYESGRVETEFARQNGIESCGVVPIYIKTIHDNIPQLVVKTRKAGDRAQDVICEALRQIFAVEKTLPEDHIPYRVMIAEDIPRNTNGKIDLYRINRGEVNGEIFRVKTDRVMGKITGFRVKRIEEESPDMLQEVFANIASDLGGDIKKNTKEEMPFYMAQLFTDNLTSKKEENKMKQNMNPFEVFNTMNQMGMKMMEQMMEQMKEKTVQNPFFNGMPDFRNMAESFRGKMPDVNALNEKAKKAHKEVAGQTEAQAAKQLSQMMAYMSKMNELAWDATVKMHDQSCRMWEKFFDMVQENFPVTETVSPAKEKSAASAKEKAATPAKEEDVEPIEKKTAPKKKPAPKKRVPKAKKEEKAEEVKAEEVK